MLADPTRSTNFGNTRYLLRLNKPHATRSTGLFWRSRVTWRKHHSLDRKLYIHAVILPPLTDVPRTMASDFSSGSKKGWRSSSIGHIFVGAQRCAHPRQGSYRSVLRFTKMCSLPLCSSTALTIRSVFPFRMGLPLTPTIVKLRPL
jgi:hypothetical protein